MGGAARFEMSDSSERMAQAAIARQPGARVVRPLTFSSDAELVEAVRRDDPAARALLFDRFAPHVRRVLARLLGTDPDLSDALHDVFVQVLSSIDKLAEPSSLKAWITTIAVYTARGRIRRRARRRWLRLLPPERVPEMPAPVADEEIDEALRATYRVLDALPADERIVFALRFIEGMALREVAAACGVSLATIKRRLARAEASFVARAGTEAALDRWLAGSKRWGEP